MAFYAFGQQKNVYDLEKRGPHLAVRATCAPFFTNTAFTFSLRVLGLFAVRKTSCSQAWFTGQGEKLTRSHLDIDTLAASFCTRRQRLPTDLNREPLGV